MKETIYEQNDATIVRELGKRFKEYRLRYDKTQKEVADYTGLSLYTVATFENGTGTGISVINLLKLLRAIDALEDIEQLLPPIPESPRLLYQQQKKKKRASKYGK